MIKSVKWLGKKTEAFTFGNQIYLNASMTFTDKQLEVIINHESIHLAQFKECTWLGFLLIYALNFIILLPNSFFTIAGGSSPYRETKFEKEAYKFEKDFNYLKLRPKFNWSKI